MPIKQNNRLSPHSTRFITINTHECTACWKCIEACPNDMIGKVSFFFHKHARFIDGSKCTGCMKCLNVCTANALQRAVN